MFEQVATIARMYRAIVVGTDGSDTASIAVDRATELAKLTGATLHIVHAFQPLSATLIGAATTTGPTFNVEQVNAGIAAGAEEVCRHAAANATRAGVNVETHPLPGDAADTLITAAKDVGADLVVVGSRGMSGVRRFILGSVPNKVSHHCPCSLLIVDTAASAANE
jgi:nucleotide-binding universal stress UspA family protein